MFSQLRDVGTLERSVGPPVGSADRADTALQASSVGVGLGAEITN